MIKNYLNVFLGVAIMLANFAECSPIESNEEKMTRVDAVLTCLHKSVRSSENTGIGEKELWFASYQIPFDSNKGKMVPDHFG